MWQKISCARFLPPMKCIFLPPEVPYRLSPYVSRHQALYELIVFFPSGMPKWPLQSLRVSYVVSPAVESRPGMMPTFTFVIKNCAGSFPTIVATLGQLLITTCAMLGCLSWFPSSRDPPDVVATQPCSSPSEKTSPDPYPCAVLSANATNFNCLLSMALFAAGLGPTVFRRCRAWPYSVNQISWSVMFRSKTLFKA